LITVIADLSQPPVAVVQLWIGRQHSHAMKIIRHFILGIGIAVILFELIFPPLRSASHAYVEPQDVDHHLVATHISRFSAWGPDLAKTEPDVGVGVVRTEVDGGELLRELAFIFVLFGAAYLWLPALVEQSAKTKLEAPKP